MEMEQVSLEEMLDAREKRVYIQQELLKKYGLPLISFTLNIPGPIKVLSGVPYAYAHGLQCIKAALEEMGARLSYFTETKSKTGYEAFLVVDLSPTDNDILALKKTMSALEDEDGLGRLFDIDIIRPDGNKVSREELGLKARRCFICGQPAAVCGRNRTHSVEELTRKVQAVLTGRLP